MESPLYDFVVVVDRILVSDSGCTPDRLGEGENL